MKKVFSVLLLVVMAVSLFSVSALAAEKVLCDMTDPAAVEEARKAQTDVVNEAYVFSLIRLPMFVLPCNAEFRAVMQANIDAINALAAEDVLYTKDTYWGANSLEGIFKDINAANKANIYHSWIRNGGWYCSNIGSWAGDWHFPHDRNQMKSVDLLDYVDIDADVKEDFICMLEEYVMGGTDDVTYGNNARWTCFLTDAECRVIEQIFADITGSGVDPDTLENNNPEKIESRKAYKNTSKEVMAASNAMLVDVYNEMAAKYPELAPYAATFAEYVEFTYGETGNGGNTNPPTADIAVIALAVSSVISLAGAFVAKKVR